MNPKLFLTHFNHIGDAPEAVPRLRRFILDLAVRGKLVEQASNDEPASQLFRRIQAEKARLVKASGTRTQKPFSPIGPDEIPFFVPQQWIWTRIRQVTCERGQKIPDKEFTYIDVTAIDKEAGCVAEAKVLSPADAPSRARKLVHRGDVLYSCVRPYLLNIAVIDTEITPAPIASTAFAVLNGFGLVLPKYLWIVLRSPFMVRCVEAKQRGQAYPAINDADFADLPFPLPPLAEQSRIVAKVQHLLALCDELQSEDREREKRRTRLTAAIAHHLTNGARPEVFREHAKFYISHTSDLTLRPEQVSVLRQTILNLAIRGQLLPQDSKDGSVAELLKSIAAENAKLQIAKGIRPQKSVAPVPSFEAETVIPKTWVHAYLQDLAYQITDGTHLTPTYTDKGRPFLSAQNVKPFRFMPENHRLVSDADFAKYRSNRRPEPGDVLLTRVGAGIGEAAVLDSDFEFAFYVSVCLIKIPTRFLNPHYLVLWLNSPEGRHSSRVRTYGKSASQGNLNLGLIRTFKIPLPPLSEQNRIVAKVAELMTICDRLEEQLRVTQTEKNRLLESVLHCALRGVSELECRTSKDGSLPTIAAEVCSL